MRYENYHTQGPTAQLIGSCTVVRLRSGATTTGKSGDLEAQAGVQPMMSSPRQKNANSLRAFKVNAESLVLLKWTR